MAEDTATATADQTATDDQTQADETPQTDTATDTDQSLLGTGASDQAGQQGATDSGSGGEPAWMQALPDELKGSESLSKFKAQNEQEALAQIAKGYVNLESKLGGKTVKVPGKNASDEEIAEYRASIGVPDSPDKYEMPTEGIPEGVQINEDMATDFKQKAHEIGLTPDQAAALYRWQAEKAGESAQSQQQQAEQQRQETVASLKKEFGNAYGEKMDLARQAIQRFGGEEVANLLPKDGNGQIDLTAANPAMVKMLSRTGQAIASDEILGEGASKTFGLSPAEAQSKISEKQLDTEFMQKYLDRNTPGHEQAVAEMKRLHEAAYPNQES